MLLTAAIFALAPAALLRELRCGWYAAHALLTLSAAWWLERHYVFPPFHKVTFFYAGILHLLAITLSTFLLYGWDKQAARRGRRRVPERTLHAFALAGGTLGALLGSRAFRHKTIKSAFRRRFRLVVLAQILIVAGLYLWAMTR